MRFHSIMFTRPGHPFRSLGYLSKTGGLTQEEANARSFADFNAAAKAAEFLPLPDGAAGVMIVEVVLL